MVAPLKVGIAGLGTVGAEVVRLIEQQGATLSARSGRSVRVVAVTARSKAKKRGLDLRGIAWAKSALALASDPGIDCFVELMGGSGDPALSAIEAALKSGKSVVTANKALSARHGLRLAPSAEKHGGALNFDAALGAALPATNTPRPGPACIRPCCRNRPRSGGGWASPTRCPWRAGGFGRSRWSVPAPAGRQPPRPWLPRSPMSRAASGRNRSDVRWCCCARPRRRQW